MSVKYPKPKFFAEYIRYLKTKKRSSNTIENYVGCLKTIPDEVEGFLASEISNLSNVIPAYRSYLEFLCRKKQLITRIELEDLKDLIKNPKRRNNHSERKVSVPKEEWGNIIRKMSKRVGKMSVWLGFTFGLRRGEIIHLRREDINFSERVIYIRDSHKEIKSKNQVKWNSKYNKSRRIDFTKNQEKTLKKWIDGIPDFVKTPYLLYTEKGPRKGLVLIGYTLFGWCKKAGINPHILRYSFATHWYEKTKDVKWVSDMLGHSSVAITSDYLCLGQKETQEKTRKYFNS